MKSRCPTARSNGPGARSCSHPAAERGVSEANSEMMSGWPLLVLLVVFSGCGGPRVLSGFGDRLGPEGFLRTDGPHRGVDVGGPIGWPVLAAADGRVVLARDNGDACGLIVILAHRHGAETIYCHMSQVSVVASDEVRRGEQIGMIGTTGLRAGPGFEHVHWELRVNGVPEDPLPKTIGCFAPSRTYSEDRLELTYPVKC